MRYLIITVVLSLCLVSVGHAKMLENKDAVKSFTQTVMGYVESGDIEAGVMHIKPYLGISSHEFKKMANTYLASVPVIKEKYGETIGTQLVKIEETDETNLHVVYNQLLTSKTLRWTFKFTYRNGNWHLSPFG